MSFFGNQLITMMVNAIKQKNPKMSPYLDEIQNGGNTTEILQKAIRNGDITKQQWNQAKPLLVKYGQQVNINVTQQDVQSIEETFNQVNYNSSYTGTNNNGFRF